MAGNSQLVLARKYPLQNRILSPNSVPHKFVSVEQVAMLGSRALMPAAVCLDSISDTSRRPWQERESPLHSLRGSVFSMHVKMQNRTKISERFHAHLDFHKYL